MNRTNKQRSFFSYSYSLYSQIGRQLTFAFRILSLSPQKRNEIESSIYRHDSVDFVVKEPHQDQQNEHMNFICEKSAEFSMFHR